MEERRIPGVGEPARQKMGGMAIDGDAGVRQQPDGSWVWLARWLGGVEQSGQSYPSREEAVQALREVIDDTGNA
jgi:hypothetical protein